LIEEEVIGQEEEERSNENLKEIYMLVQSGIQVSKKVFHAYIDVYFMIYDGKHTITNIKFLTYLIRKEDTRPATIDPKNIIGRSPHVDCEVMIGTPKFIEPSFRRKLDHQIALIDLVQIGLPFGS